MSFKSDCGNETVIVVWSSDRLWVRSFFAIAFED
jgi:hypothetical protein